jgi:hypothetical protein
MSIKPGIRVAINLHPSSESEKPLHVIVYDVRGKHLVLSQTSPPLLPPPPTSYVDISYISGKGSSMRRRGFSARVLGFGKDYQLNSGMRVPTIIVEMIDGPQEKSLRQGFRIETPRRSGLLLAIQERNYPIYDISLMGVNFIQPSLDPPFKTSTVLECRLKIDGQDYRIKARVIRSAETAAARHIAVMFINPGKDFQHSLSRKILHLEREHLSRHGC